MMSHSGELPQTHGHSRSEATQVHIIGQTASGGRVYGPGVPYRPRLCQVDAEGSVLVVDYSNVRLHVMRADGTWSVVDFDQHVCSPRGAVWCNESLYVANIYTIVRFSAP